MRQGNPNTHDYQDAGFNRFYRRSLGSSADSASLNSLPPSNNRGINFDNSQISGAMGDNVRVGTIVLNGKIGRISVFEDGTLTTETVRLGDVLDG